jgi:hypothetical protein
MTITAPVPPCPPHFLSAMTDPAASRLCDGPARPTASLHRLATAAFGEAWPTPFARFTGIALRTCQRLREAAELGRESPAAPGVLTAYMKACTEQAQAAFGALTTPIEGGKG